MPSGNELTNTPGFNPLPFIMVSPVELAIQTPLLLIKKLPCSSDMVASVPLNGILRNSLDNKYEFCENTILAFAANGEFSLPINHVLFLP
jgi:hypothetical protein